MHREFNFCEPWERASSPHKTLKQLESVLSPEHELYGSVRSVIASRVDSDDLLVQTQTGYALVHLTWCRRSRPAAPFPHTVSLETWEEFLQKFYRPQLEQWNLSHPPDEWDELLARPYEPE